MNMADPCIEAGGEQTQELTYWVPCYTPLPCFLLQFFTTLLIPLIVTCRSYHSILLFSVLSNSTQSHPSEWPLKIPQSIVSTKFQPWFCL